MKRGGPLRRSTPLRSTTPLRKVSKKREVVARKRRALVAEILGLRPICDAGFRIELVDLQHRCQKRSVDLHEPLTRARGGDILDRSNIVPVCRACHDWIHAHPALATEIDLLRSSGGSH